MWDRGAWMVLFVWMGLACGGWGSSEVKPVEVPLMVTEQGDDCVACYIACMAERPEDMDEEQWADADERSESCEVWCVQAHGGFE